MIKYKVLVKQVDDSFTDFGTIEGKDKRELGLALHKLCHAHNIEIGNVKLECIEFDKKEILWYNINILTKKEVY